MGSHFTLSVDQAFHESLYLLVVIIRTLIVHHQVWGILETRDQNYRSNARPRLRLADLLTEVVILLLHRGSERQKFDYWFIILARFR